MIGFQKYSILDNVHYSNIKLNSNKVNNNVDKNINLYQRIVNKKVKHIVKGKRIIYDKEKLQK
jgi:hypothetical protein